MGKLPSVIIVARHGARFDQSNKDWHTTAEKPWDPPLSYGGWIQCQSLGARIANELRNLDAPIATEGLGIKTDTDVTSAPRPRKRRRITLHSSPYLRCVQTSIAIAAGLRHPQDLQRARPLPTALQRSSLSKPPLISREQNTIPEDEATNGSLERTRESQGATPLLTDLKLDPWLGEWLSSGYYEKISPPPPSAEIVQSAKEMLKRPPEDIKGADLARSIQEFSEIEWVGPDKDPKSLPQNEKTGLRAMAAAGHSFPRRSRTVSFGKEATNGGAVKEAVGRRPRSMTYSPPVPTYSIAPQDAIPIGFVAHARDGCVDPDFEWNSAEPPLQWGDGGHYEEEWSTMHRRFRNGLQGMLNYYGADPTNDSDADELDEELVVILVTHQAGCNALIRLLTGAPALHDVGTASLTLAVRKPGLTRQTSRDKSVSPARRRGSLDLGIDQDFDMKIIASTEHLRSGSNPLGLNSPRLGQSPAFASRRVVGAESLEGFSIGDPLSWRSSSSSGGLGRSRSQRVHAADSPSLTPILDGGGGLWKSRTNSVGGGELSIDPRANIFSATAIPEGNEETWTTDEAEISASPSVSAPALMGNGHTNSRSATYTSPTSTWESTSRTDLPVRTVGQTSTSSTGLWGSNTDITVVNPSSRSSFSESMMAPPTSLRRERSPGTKRRWTAVER